MGVAQKVWLGLRPRAEAYELMHLIQQWATWTGSSLVGSIATMDVLVRTMAQNAGVPLADAVRMASETPARLMGVDDRKGSLQRGKDADIVILDRKLNVRSVWSMGHLVEGTNTLA